MNKPITDIYGIERYKDDIYDLIIYCNKGKRRFIRGLSYNELINYIRNYGSNYINKKTTTIHQNVIQSNLYKSDIYLIIYID